MLNIDDKYKQYLSLMSLDESTMPTVQRLQTKRAFMGGFGMALIAMRDEIGSIEDEDAAVQALDATIQAVNSFWQTQI